MTLCDCEVGRGGKVSLVESEMMGGGAALAHLYLDVEGAMLRIVDMCGWGGRGREK